MNVQTHQYDIILDALRNLKAQGEEGFEGFIRDLLQSLCGRTLRLAKSGPQSGRDMNTEPNFLQTGVAIEAKRFDATTSLPLDELKAKLQEAIDTLPSLDVWGVALSREMKEPDWSELVRIAADKGVLSGLA